MGTSSSHSGNKDNKGLLPSDYDGQQSKPEVSWQATKTGFSKYINGHGGGVSKTAKNYVKAAGGTAGLVNSSKSGIKGAINIGMIGVWKKERQWKEVEADYIINDLKELPVFVSAINKG